MKPGKNFSELCYTYIYEASWLCDYEILTDELCAQIGMAHSQATLDKGLADIAPVLSSLQELVMHANGSIRGKMALEEANISWLHECYGAYQKEISAKEPTRLKKFVLPRGTDPVPQLHQARSTAKKALRALVRIEQEGKTIPPEIPRFLNLTCNFLFLLTVLVNQRRQIQEPVFVSKSYRLKAL